QEANALGYGLLLDLLHSPLEANVEQVLNLMGARRVDGIIWAVHDIGNNHAWVDEDLLDRLPPVVFLTMEPRAGVAVVNTDNARGAELATRHLIEQGRQVI